ncbi:MAG: AsmA family protein, partial [Nitrospirae bacterium]|nr:AsmA family protein [Nitrospirota bacterium]
MFRRGYIRFLVAGAAGLLLAAALLALARIPASEQILSFATEALREDLGHEVTIEKASVYLFPPRLDFQGVTVPDSQGRSLMTIQRVRGYLNPLKLLWNTLALRRLRLDGVDLLVEIDPHERLNLSPLLDAVRRAVDRPSRGIEIQVREILLVDSRVRYVDRHRGIEAEGSGVLFELKLPRSVGGNYSGRLVVAEIHTNESGVRSQESEGAGPGSLEVEGKVRGGDSPVIDLRGRLRLDAGLVAPLLGTQGSGKGDLRFALKGEYPALEADGDLALAKVSLAGAALTEGSAKVRFKENKLRLTGAVLRLYGGELRGEGSFEFRNSNFEFENGRYQLRAEYKGIGLKPLIPGGMASPDLPPGTISGEIALEGSGFDGLTASGGRTASMQGKGTMRYRGPDDRVLEGLSRTGRHFGRFATGEAAWVLRDGEVVMDRAVFESPDSTLSLEGAVRLPQGLGLEVRLESRRLGEPFILLDFPDATGRLTLQGALRGTIEEPRLEARIQIQEAWVRDVPFQRAEGGIVWVPGRVTLTAMHLEQGESTYRLEGEFPVGQSKVPGRATLEARQGDPGMAIRLFTRPLPVRMQLDGKMAFQGTPDRFSWEGILRGSGQAYGQQYDQARAKVRVTDREVFFDQLTALVGTGVVQGKGRIGYDGSYGGQLSAQGVELRQVDYLKDWGLPFEGKGNLRLEGEGRFAAPVLKGSVAFPQVTYRGMVMGRADGEVETQKGILHGRIRLFERQAEVRATYDPTRSHRWEVGLELRQGRLDPFLHLWRLERLTKAAITTTGSLQMRGEGWDLDRMELSARFPQFNLEIGGYQAQGDSVIAVEMRNRLFRILSMRFKGEGTSLAVTGTARAG